VGRAERRLSAGRRGLNDVAPAKITGRLLVAGTGRDLPAVILAPRPREDQVSQVFLESAELERLGLDQVLKRAAVRR
jgi:hypothetical protein